MLQLAYGQQELDPGSGKMLAVRGIYEKGRARPLSRVRGRDGQPVIITFLEDASEAERKAEVETGEAWQAMTQLIASCTVETGTHDLAHRHDAYLHHTPPEA
jgi:hypothetical protein